MISPKIYDCKNFTLQIFPQYAINIVKEGVNFDVTEKRRLYKIFEDNFNKPFGYISNRENDYSVNPLSYILMPNYPEVIAMAVICTSAISVKTAKFEGKFFKAPFEIFCKKEQAINWVEHLVHNCNQKYSQN